MTRMPRPLRASTFFVMTRRISSSSGVTAPSYSTREHTLSISSTAPLVITCVRPSRRSTTTLIRRRSKSKGISSTLL